MSAPFQIGDRVRINFPEDPWHGLTATVVAVLENGCAQVKPVNSSERWSFYPDELVLVERAS